MKKALSFSPSLPEVTQVLITRCSGGGEDRCSLLSTQGNGYILRPVSGLILRDAYGCIPILFPKDHGDVSTREKTVPTSTIQEKK